MEYDEDEVVFGITTDEWKNSNSYSYSYSNELSSNDSNDSNEYETQEFETELNRQRRNIEELERNQKLSGMVCLTTDSQSGRKDEELYDLFTYLSDNENNIVVQIQEIPGYRDRYGLEIPQDSQVVTELDQRLSSSYLLCAKRVRFSPYFSSEEVKDMTKPFKDENNRSYRNIIINVPSLSEKGTSENQYITVDPAEFKKFYDSKYRFFAFRNYHTIDRYEMQYYQTYKPQALTRLANPQNAVVRNQIYVNGRSHFYYTLDAYTIDDYLSIS